MNQTSNGVSCQSLIQLDLNSKSAQQTLEERVLLTDPVLLIRGVAKIAQYQSFLETRFPHLTCEIGGQSFTYKEVMFLADKLNLNTCPYIPSKEVDIVF